MAQAQEYIEVTAEGIGEGIEDVALSFDWWTPSGQAALAAMGYATILGWVAELKALDKAGISYHFPMAVDDPGGDYMWVMYKKDLAKAQRRGMLKGER